MIFKYNTVISRVFLIISNQRRKSEKYMERYEIYFNTNIISEIIKEDRVNNNFHKKKKINILKSNILLSILPEIKKRESIHFLVSIMGHKENTRKSRSIARN